MVQQLNVGSKKRRRTKFTFYNIDGLLNKLKVQNILIYEWFFFIFISSIWIVPHPVHKIC